MKFGQGRLPVYTFQTKTKRAEKLNKVEGRTLENWLNHFAFLSKHEYMIIQIHTYFER